MNVGEIGKNVAFLRRHKGWTQKELAAKISVSDKAVGKWEKGLGLPDVCNISLLAEVFGVSVDFLINEVNINELSRYEAIAEYKTKNQSEQLDVDGVRDDLRMLTENNVIAPAFYENYDVKKGLRGLSGDGVIAGLTNICTIIGQKSVDGTLMPCAGELRYRGYDVKDLVGDFVGREQRFGYEEVVFLLLFGQLPTVEQKGTFLAELAKRRALPTNFLRDILMKSPSTDTMNTIAKGLLSLAAYDKNAMDTSIENVLSQSLYILSVFPMLVVYAYDAFVYTSYKQTLVIRYPLKEYSTAENILYMLRPDGKFSPHEAALLDIMLTLHADHGGGNNSTFTTRVVTSTGTDTYSAITASLCSLKGGKHGGANRKVAEMFADLKRSVKNLDDEQELSDYIARLLDKKAFDKSGLVYGMGHAVYSLSDPRAEILKANAKKLAAEKGLENEYRLYETVERLAKRQIAEKRRIYKGVSVNVDFYSGFVYSMLGIPEELFTPIFAIARIAGWSAHRIEELLGASKVIRPAYVGVAPERTYVRIEDRP